MPGVAGTFLGPARSRGAGVVSPLRQRQMQWRFSGAVRTGDAFRLGYLVAGFGMA